MYLYGQLTQRTDMKKPRNYRKEYVRTQGTAKGKLDRAARNKARKMLLNNNRNFSPCDKCDVDGLLNGNDFKQSWEKYFFEKKN